MEGLDQNGWYNHYFILCYFASDEIKLKVIKINFKKNDLNILNA